MGHNAKRAGESDSKRKKVWYERVISGYLLHEICNEATFLTFDIGLEKIKEELTWIADYLEKNVYINDGERSFVGFKEVIMYDGSKQYELWNPSDSTNDEAPSYRPYCLWTDYTDNGGIFSRIWGRIEDAESYSRYSPDSSTDIENLSNRYYERLNIINSEIIDSVKNEDEKNALVSRLINEKRELQRNLLENLFQLLEWVGLQITRIEDGPDGYGSDSEYDPKYEGVWRFLQPDKPRLIDDLFTTEDGSYGGRPYPLFWSLVGKCTLSWRSSRLSHVRLLLLLLKLIRCQFKGEDGGKDLTKFIHSSHEFMDFSNPLDLVLRLYLIDGNGDFVEERHEERNPINSSSSASVHLLRLLFVHDRYGNREKWKKKEIERGRKHSLETTDRIMMKGVIDLMKWNINHTTNCSFSNSSDDLKNIIQFLLEPMTDAYSSEEKPTLSLLFLIKYLVIAEGLELKDVDLDLIDTEIASTKKKAFEDSDAARKDGLKREEFESLRAQQMSLRMKRKREAVSDDGTKRRSIRELSDLNS